MTDRFTDNLITRLRLLAAYKCDDHSIADDAILSIELLTAVADAAADWLLGTPTFALDVPEAIERLKAALRVAGYKPRK